VDLPTWIEFHDSTLAALDYTATDLRVVLDAYVHRWDLVADDWVGTGWMRLVRILITHARCQSSVTLVPVEITHGRLHVGTVTYSNLVPLPFKESEAINLWIQVANADVLDCVGDSVQIEAQGEARFVEDLPGDMRPDLKRDR